jgi:hypothetical protein
MNIKKDNSHIPNWGIDADTKNDPTYPIKHRTDHDHEGYTWNRNVQQPVTTEVLQSIERPNVSAVFGDTIPPSGLSGHIRRYAFQHGEGKFRHWLPLILADRVNEIEGIIDDIKNGHFPNIFAEKGMKAAWTHDRKNVIKSVLIGAALTYVFFKLVSRKEE